MPPWLRILDAVLGLTDMALRKAGTRSLQSEPREGLSLGSPASGSLEQRLAGVVVAALKEAFDRDHQRLDLERQQMEAERQRAERALRLELARQAGDREIGRMRLLAGVAVASWLGTLFFSTRLIGGQMAARVALGAGWLLLLAALAAAFAGQSRVAAALAETDERSFGRPLTGGGFGQTAPWLIVAGLAAIALAVLLA
jgi:hypothetical protein